jgi:hypothetical protein
MYKFQQLPVTASSQSTNHTGGQAALGGGSRVERQPKEDVGSTPPSRSKNPQNKGFFVTNHLYPTGAGIGLVGELFAFGSSFLLSHTVSSAASLYFASTLCSVFANELAT